MQNLRFDAALNNMSHGLAMYDDQSRLIVSNKRYAKIYNMPIEVLQPGTPHEAVLEARIASGIFAGRDSRQSFENCLEDARYSTWL